MTATATAGPWEALQGFRILRTLRTRERAPLAALALREPVRGFSRPCSLEAVPDSPDASAQVEALLREASIEARLRHPAVAQVFEIVRPDGWIVVVRPVDGSLTLAHLGAALARHSSRLDERIVWHIAHTLFDCLDEVHHNCDSRGEPLVHGDLRPGQVIVRSDGSIVVRGFGRTRLDWVPAGESARRGMYQPPECSAGAPPSIAADLYAAALMVWELLVDPADCRALRSACEAGETDLDIPSLAVLRADLPPAITSSIDLCLSPDPDARSVPASAVATAIHRSVDVLGGRELLARLHANVLSRLQGRPNPRWATEPSRPGGVDCAAPTLRLSPSPARSEPAPPPAVLHPDHPLCDAARTRPPSPVDDDSDTIRWTRDETPLWREDDADQVTSPSTGNTARPASEVPPVQALVSSLPPVSSPSVNPGDPAVDPSSPARPRRRWAPGALAAVCVAAFLGYAAARSAQSQATWAAASRASSIAASDRMPVASAQPAPTAAVSAVAPTATIAVWRTRLVVHGPPDGTVFVQGVPVGRTGQALDVPCGQRYVRVGTDPIHGAMLTVRWLSNGFTMNLPCGGAVERTLQP
jgi:serine/threonine protein kinase